MSILKVYNKKGQSIAEMAIFGSLILFIFGTCLSYMQRYNNQQYVQMEAFRRALQKANTGLGSAVAGAGASVQFSVIQNRRAVDVSDNFKKGSGQSVSASSDVFWAVPKAAQDPENLIVYRINEDEKQVNVRDYVPRQKANDWTFRVENMTSDSSLSFNQETTKEETAHNITNQDNSSLQETIGTSITYSIRQKDSDYNPDNDPVVSQGTFWELEQGLYHDTDGQYKYSTDAAGTVTERAKKWQTPF